MTRYNGHLCHRILASVRIEVGTAESNVFNAQQHFAVSALRFIYFSKLYAEWCSNL